MRRLTISIPLSFVVVPVLSSLATVFCMNLAAQPSSEDSRPTGSQEAEDSAGEAADTSPVTLLRGLDVPVRGREENDVTDDTLTVSYEAYYDWDFGVVTLVSETGDIATIPSMQNWELRAVEDAGGDLVSLCFRPGSGETYLMNERGEWELVQEAPDEERIMGDYEVMLSVSRDDLLSVLRMDRLSGRTWMLEEQGWKPVAGNLQDWPK